MPNSGTDISDLRIVDPGKGASQIGVRAHNERLVLSLIRRHGSLSKAEIARRCGFSAQTASVIIRALEQDDLLTRLEPVRGKVGQPSVPMALNPDGAFSIGLKIGRRSAELIVLDFVGVIRKRLAIQYEYPLPDALMAFLRGGIETLSEALEPELRARVAGIGIGAPFELWNWLDPVGAPEDEMERWRDFNFIDEIAAISDLPVYVENDATAACSAEHAFGRGREFSDYVYFFVGYFVGGGIVLDHAVYRGRSGNAGALGSMPVHGRGRRQLIQCASLFLLEQMLAEAGIEPGASLTKLDNWDDFEAQAAKWIDLTGVNLASAAASACSVIDFEAVVIDGSLPPDIRARLVARVRAAMAKLDLRGISPPEIVEGGVGNDARAMGAASLPLFARYLLESGALFGSAGMGGDR